MTGCPFQYAEPVELVGTRLHGEHELKSHQLTEALATVSSR